MAGYYRSPLVLFAICFILGIVTARFAYFSWFSNLWVAVVSFAVLCFLWFRMRKRVQQGILFGIIACFCFFLLGSANYSIRLPEASATHFSHCISDEDPQLLQLKIKEVLRPSVYGSRYIAEVYSINNYPSEGRLLFYADSLLHFSIDDVVWAVSIPKSIGPPRNPFQFDFVNYMATHGVHHSIRVSTQDILSHTAGTSTIKGFASRLRNQVLEKLEHSALGADERAILQALVLGYKFDIGPETYQTYTQAGAVHILAVSGLHVGILFVLLRICTRPLRYFPYGKSIASGFVIFGLFGFALLAGWSPSVVRAATMFSLFAFAQAIDRDTHASHTLFISALFLLVLNPSWLFHVGFQLSYLAVLGILLIQPHLSLWYRPKYYIMRKLWDMVTVSLAAQLGVLPLTLYYFHQFPGLFLLTNVVVLPFLSALLIGGIFVSILILCNTLPDWLALGYSFCIETLNRFIAWVAHMDPFVIEDISFSGGMVVVSYLFLASLLWFVSRPLAYRLKGVLCVMLLGVVVLFLSKYKSSGNELVIFHKTRETLIGYKQGQSLTILRSDTALSMSKFPIRDYRIGNQISSYREHHLPAVFDYTGNRFLIIDSTAVYPSAREIDFVVLTQNPRLHLDRLIDSLAPQAIIADGSNYKSYVHRWSKTCQKRKLSFHHTGTQGAFSIR